MKTRTKESKRRLHSLILLTAFTAVLLIVSTYAWFTVQESVSVNQIRGKVEVAEGLEISLDAKKWVGSLDLGASDTSLIKTSEEDSNIKYGPYTGHNNHVTDTFVPVSTSGETIAVLDEKTPAKNDMDYLAFYSGKYSDSKLTDVTRLTEGLDSDDKLVDTKAGFIAFDLFIKNSSKNGASAETLQLNSDSYVWVLPDEGEDIGGKWGENYKGDAGSGLQNTVRIGFAKYGGDAVIKGTSAAETILEETRKQAISDVAIWEPYADTHVTYIIDRILPRFDAAMGAGHGFLTAETGNAFITRTLNKNALTGIDNVYNWKDNADGDPEVAGFTKTATMQTADNGKKDGKITGIRNIDTIEGEGEELKISPNAVTRLRIYIWMEGQDPDCDNFASYGGGLDINLGFTKGKAENGNQAGQGGTDADPDAPEENVVGG
ncbi:MAG: hypothetical protein IKL55_05680 [Clostridia bacterium]|nr:hypothetical protein [Clostridia bacterium]